MRFAIAVAAFAILGTVPIANAQPQIPSTFFGTASIDGKVPPADTDVRALIDGLDCTQDGPARRFVLDAGVGLYVVTVVHESQKPGCGRDGRTVTFTVGGRPAAQSAKWVAGPQQLDLNAGSGSAVPLPPATATPTGRVSLVTPSAGNTQPGGSPVSRTGTPPVDPITLTPSSGVRPIDSATGAIDVAVTPGPPSAGDKAGANDGGILAPIVLGLAVLAMAGAAAGFVLSRRRGERNGQA